MQVAQEKVARAYLERTSQAPGSVRVKGQGSFSIGGFVGVVLGWEHVRQRDGNRVHAAARVPP